MNVPSLKTLPPRFFAPRGLEYRFQRRDVGDHFFLRHRIGLAAGRRIGERFQVRKHGLRGLELGCPSSLAANVSRKNPALRRLGMRLVAHLDPALAAVDGEAAVERRREAGVEKRMPFLEIDQDRQGVAVRQMTSKSFYR